MKSTPDQRCRSVLSGDRQSVESAKPVRQPRAAQHHREPNLHLPPHLREVCALLAAGLVRLRRRTAEELAHDAAHGSGQAESSLHFTARQSGDADPKERPTA